jgi:uncharacterized protein YyaL (SSP411 family)
MAATVLIRLGKLLGRRDYLDAAASTLDAGAAVMQRAPMAAGQMLLALDHFLGPSRELVLIGDLGKPSTMEAWGELRIRYLPRSVVAIRDSPPEPKIPHCTALDELFSGRESKDGEPVLYICENFTCQEPAIGRAAIAAALDKVN